MLTENISFKNFLTKKKILITKKNLNLILNEKNQLIRSLSKSLSVSVVSNFSLLLFSVINDSILFVWFSLSTFSFDGTGSSSKLGGIDRGD